MTTEQHFFAASVTTWATTNESRDLRSLLKLMDKEGYDYNLFLVPGDSNSNYEIRLFQPQVEGTQWLGFFKHKQGRSTAKRS